jgi:predicted amidohydrolase
MDRRSFLGRTALLPWLARRVAPVSETVPPVARSVRVGLCQMRVETGARDENLSRARAMVARARGEGCDVALLPECLDLGWTYPEAPARAQPIPGPASEALAEAAREHGIWVVAGLTERDGDRTFNTSVLLDEGGRIRLKHHKINELDIAWDIYTRGTALEVADTPFGRLGITICADNSPDSVALGLALGAMGARLILSPCAWAVDADHDNEKEPYGRDVWDPAYTLLAQEAGLATVGVSNVGRLEAGPWKGRLCIGSSLAVGGDGTVLARAPYGVDAETMLAVDIPLRR